MVEEDGSADDGSKAQDGEPLRLNPEIVILAAWSPQERRGLTQIRTRLIKRGLFWIETIALTIVGTWLYERLPARHVAPEQPSVIGQPSAVVDQSSTDEE